MCCISRPVQEVADTNILVARLETDPNFQLTVYQNKVHNQSPKNAMIIAVPSPSTVRIHNLSSARDLFTRLHSFFTPIVVEEIYYFNMKSADDEIRQPAKLKVERVGDYNVSLVPSMADLKRVDDSYFLLSDGVIQALSIYPSSWGFLVFGLSDESTHSRKYSPFAFSHELPYPDQLYIPTLHYHEHTRVITQDSKFDVMKKVIRPQGVLADWNHDIYVYGVEDQYLWASTLPGLAAGSAYYAKKYKNVFVCNHSDCLVELWPEAEAGVSLPKSPFFKKFRIEGDQPNGDIFLPVRPREPAKSSSSSGGGGFGGCLVC